MIPVWHTHRWYAEHDQTYHQFFTIAHIQKYLQQKWDIVEIYSQYWTPKIYSQNVTVKNNLIWIILINKITLEYIYPLLMYWLSIVDWFVLANDNFYLNNKKLIVASKVWLVCSSLFFYGWWDIAYLPLILSSVVFNFIVGSLIKKTLPKNIFQTNLC